VLVGWDEHVEWGMRQAAVWVGGQRQLLETSDWPSEAAAVDAAGTRIVGQAWDAGTGVESAVMWTADGTGWQRQVLGVLPDTQWDGSAYATGLSDDGQVVVGWGRLQFGPQTHGWVWTPGTGLMEARAFLSARGIDLPRRYQVYEVGAVSGDGRTLALGTLDRSQPGSIRALLVRLPAARAR
jgi:probable HAF family extracellular repeat protein